MQTATDTKLNGEKGPRGRKNRDKQEAVIETAKLKDKLSYLVKLKKASDSASTEFNDAIKATAEKSGLLASVVRKVVVAASGEDYEAKQREAEQLSLAFEECAGG